MFDAHCPTCAKRYLIFPSQVRRIVNDDHGILVVYTCWCGAVGAQRTGAATRRDVDVTQHVLAS